MPTKVAFVVAIGRMSVGNETALPKVQSICAQYGGSVTGGVGSSADPIIGVFGDAAQAAKAAQQAWYLDDVEAAKVLGTDAPGPIETPAGEVPGAAPDRGPSQYPLDYGIKEAVTDVVSEKKSISEAVDALLAAPVVEAKKKEEKERGEKESGKEGKGDKDKDDADDKKKVEEAKDGFDTEAAASVVNRHWDANSKDADTHPGTCHDCWAKFMPAVSKELRSDDPKHAKALKKIRDENEVGGGPETAGEFVAMLHNHR